MSHALGRWAGGEKCVCVRKRERTCAHSYFVLTEMQASLQLLQQSHRQVRTPLPHPQPHKCTHFYINTHQNSPPPSLLSCFLSVCSKHKGAHSHMAVFTQRLHHLDCLNFSSTATGRRSAPPLNLTGLPGTEKLNEREKEVQLLVFVFLSLVELLFPPLKVASSSSAWHQWAARQNQYSIYESVRAAVIDFYMYTVLYRDVSLYSAKC